MRIAVGGIHIECSTDSPINTTLADFRVAYGDEMLDRPGFAFLRTDAYEVFPTLHARAIPGGPVERATYEHLKADHLARLRAAMPVDGVYLAMHGAMFVEGMEDAEGDWIAATRDVVGKDCVISASYDLHGNLSHRIIDALDILTAYRTAPHIDVEETQLRAWALLTNCLDTGLVTYIMWVSVPVLLPGEVTSTRDEPAKSLYHLIPSCSVIEGVLDASILIGYVWADEPRAAASVVVIGSRVNGMTEAAEQLSMALWEARHRFAFGTQTGTIENCLEWAAQSAVAPVILADSGDNPTAGGVGDRCDVLRHLLANGTTNALVAGIADQPATDACYQQGVGGDLTLSIGGTLGGTPDPVQTSAHVLFLASTDNPRDRQAVVRCAGVTVVLTARRRPFHNESDFSSLGILPTDFQLVVVKSGYLSPYLAPLAGLSVMALSPGAVDQDIERLPRTRLPSPLFPFQRDFEWSPDPFVGDRWRDYIGGAQ